MGHSTHVVHAGCLLKAIGRRLLHIALLHYVDDYFAGDRQESVTIAKNVFAKLVRLCLGGSAIAERKLQDGNPLEVLGVDTELGPDGLVYWPAGDKVSKWLQCIKLARKTRLLPTGSSSKLTGKLSWGTQSCFKRLGRAMLRPLISHTATGSPTVTDETDLGLAWWEEVLGCELRCAVSFLVSLEACDCFIARQAQEWQRKQGKQMHIFADARGFPPRIAAVLFRWSACTCGFMHGGAFCGQDWPKDALLRYARP